MEQKTVSKITKEKASDYVRIIISDLYKIEPTSVKYIGGGSFGFVYKVIIPAEPYKLIVKAFRTSDMHADESNALKKLAQNSILHIPKVYHTVDANDTVPMDFIIEELIEGTDCFTDFKKLFCSRKNKEKFANAVADALANWHCVTNDKFGDLDNPVFDDWLDYYKPFASDILSTAIELNKKGLIDRKTISTMQTAWNNFDIIFSEKVECAVLIHGDLNVMNIMSDSKLNVTGIIDPLYSKWADKEYDLFQLKNLTGEFFNLYDTYKAKYNVSKNCDLKCSFYALFNEVYCFILTGTSTKIILKKAEKWLNKELKKAGFKN